MGGVNFEDLFHKYFVEKSSGKLFKDVFGKCPFFVKLKSGKVKEKGKIHNIIELKDLVEMKMEMKKGNLTVSDFGGLKNQGGVLCKLGQSAHWDFGMVLRNVLFIFGLKTSVRSKNDHFNHNIKQTSSESDPFLNEELINGSIKFICRIHVEIPGRGRKIFNKSEENPHLNSCTVNEVLLWVDHETIGELFGLENTFLAKMIFQ